jgi:cytidylate kinase
MRLIGLAAPMRCGKDTVADYLVAQHDFLKFSFSDGLYREVAAAYGLDDESLLRDAETKESDTAQLALSSCRDPEFARRLPRAVGLRDDE